MAMNPTTKLNSSTRFIKAISLLLVSAYLVSCGGSSVTPSTTSSGITGNETTSNISAQFGLEGFSQCGNEGDTIDLSVKTHLAYGAKNAFVYLFNQTGKVKIDTVTFGSDPIFGTGKFVFCKPVVEGADAPRFIAAMAKIKQHLNGSALLTPAQINEQTSIVSSTMFTIVGNATALSEAINIVELYDKAYGAFFIGATTKGGFANAPGAADGAELARAVFALQQGVFDHAYNAVGFAQYRAILVSKKFSTSDFYPGKVKLAADANRTYTAKINASMPKFEGKPTAFSSTPALRPTGYYLAAGDVAIVTVPQVMVNKGFTLQVGAHKQDKTGSGPVKRFFRISNKFAITSTQVEIANPFGGGIYINVPYLADAGIVDVQIKNAVPAPFFSATAHNKTSLADWIAVQRNNPAPWADFESDKFMMQVPTNFIYAYADPVELMRHWDMRLDAVSELIGQPLVRNNVILYIQADTDIMFSGYGIGYPAINNAYNPADATDGNKKIWYLSASSDFWPTEFHELGHAQLFSNFPGEGEAAVNLLAAAIWNQKYGVDLDLAFGKSFLNQTQIDRDQAAINWMVTQNFRDGKPMDTSNTTKDEVRYQHRGWAKYVEIAALFGWDKLSAFYKQENTDFTTPVVSDGLSVIDSRIFRMSKSAGVDLTPLIHFWGVQPVDKVKLASAITGAGLKPSALIYDRLTRYKSQIPLDNASFTAHAKTFLGIPTITAGPSPDYGEGWYFSWLPLYGAAHGTQAQTAMTDILNRYFPAGRPN
jgi:Peptidase M60, enhancin and enhancin-like/N-terminal domain of M60-like peptidases